MYLEAKTRALGREETLHPSAPSSDGWNKKLALAA